ncbi:unnamed protein product, partial [Ixodes pacificus]
RPCSIDAPINGAKNAYPSFQNIHYQQYRAIPVPAKRSLPTSGIIYNLSSVWSCCRDRKQW